MRIVVKLKATGALYLWIGTVSETEDEMTGSDSYSVTRQVIVTKAALIDGDTGDVTTAYLHEIQVESPLDLKVDQLARRQS